MEKQTFIFDSFSDFLELAKEDSKPNVNDSRRQPKSKDWDDNAGFKKSIKLAECGWKGTDLIKDFGDSITANVFNDVVEPQVAYDVVGASPDVAAYLSGVPECMLRWDETEAKSRNILKIAINGAFGCTIRSEKVIERGGAVLSVIDLLESCGYRCEVYCLFGSKKGNGLIEIATKIKEPFEQIDIDRFSFMVAHPATFRRLGFSVLEKANDKVRKECCVYNDGTYGRPPRINDYECLTDFDVVFDNVSNYINYTEDWVKEMLKKSDIEIE